MTLSLTDAEKAAPLLWAVDVAELSSVRFRLRLELARDEQRELLVLLWRVGNGKMGGGPIIVGAAVVAFAVVIPAGREVDNLWLLCSSEGYLR